MSTGLLPRNGKFSLPMMTVAHFGSARSAEKSTQAERGLKAEEEKNVKEKRTGVKSVIKSSWRQLDADL